MEKPPIVADATPDTSKTATGITAGIARLQSLGKGQSDRHEPIDYHGIIANAVAVLDPNTAETRHAVYECARQVVYQRLSHVRSNLSPGLVEQEREALDSAIDRIEATNASKSAPASPPNAPKAAPLALAPVILNAPQRDLPQASHFHFGALRLFGVAGVICTGLFSYWLFAGMPKIRPAAEQLHLLPRDTAAGRDNALTSAESVTEKQTEADAAPTPASPSEPARKTVDGQPNGAEQTSGQPRHSPPPARPAQQAVPDCSGIPCGFGNAGVSSAAQPDGDKASPSWISTYATLASKSPPEPSPDASGTKTAPGNPAATAAAKPATDERFERGLQQAKDGDPELAIRYFTDAIRADPNFSDGYLQRGNMRFKNGNADLAIDDFNEAIRTNPQNAAAFKSRAMVLLYKGDEPSALDDLTRAIQIAETDAPRLSALELFFARRSRVAIYARRHAEERQLFDLSAMIDAYWRNPDLADALKVNYGVQGSATVIASIYRQRAALYQQRDNIDGAIGDLSHALQLDPAHALAIIVERARMEEASGRREQALADFRRALELNPRSEEARLALTRLKN